MVWKIVRLYHHEKHGEPHPETKCVLLHVIVASKVALYIFFPKGIRRRFQ